MDPGGFRFWRGCWTFERDGRAAPGLAAGDARPGLAHCRGHSGRAFRAVCCGKPARGGVIGRIEQAAGRPVSRETLGKLEAYAALLVDENQRQNLVSPSTIDQLWERHVVDSAQLVRFEPHAGASWLDIGSGAGLPGIVIACLIDGP